MLVSTTDNRKTISNFHPTKFRSVQNTMGQITGEKARRVTVGVGLKKRFFFFFIYNIKMMGDLIGSQYTTSRLRPAACCLEFQDSLNAYFFHFS